MIVSLLQNNDGLCHSMWNRTLSPFDLEIERRFLVTKRDFIVGISKKYLLQL